MHITLTRIEKYMWNLISIRARSFDNHKDNHKRKSILTKLIHNLTPFQCTLIVFFCTQSTCCGILYRLYIHLFFLSHRLPFYFSLCGFVSFSSATLINIPSLRNPLISRHRSIHRASHHGQASQAGVLLHVMPDSEFFLSMIMHGCNVEKHVGFARTITQLYR